MHPEIDGMVAELVKRKKFVFLCTNALLLRRQLDQFTPVARTSRWPCTSTACASATTRRSTARACSTRRSRRSGRPSSAGFRVTTNTTFFNTDTPQDGASTCSTSSTTSCRSTQMMISPAYAYEKAPDQEHFLGVDRDPGAVPQGVRRRSPRSAGGSTTRPLFLDFLEGKVDFDCTAWAIPSYSLFGWQRPVLPDGRRLRRRRTRSWSRPPTGTSYGRGQGPALRQLHGALRLRAHRGAGHDALAAPVAAGDRRVTSAG